MNASPQAIRVYLDTSDYWEISKALSAQKSGPIVDLYRYLMDRREDGIIDVRFSIVHVLELIDHAPEHKSNAAERCRVMRELTDDMPMIPLDALVRKELRSALHGIEFATEAGLAARGNWFPDFKPSLENFRQVAIQDLKDALRDKNWPRAQRKAILTRIFDSGGRLTPRGLELLKANRRPHDMARLEKDNPISEAFYLDGSFDRYLLGKASAEALAIELALGAFRADNIVSVYAERYGTKLEPLLGWVREFGAQLIGTIQQTQNDIAQIALPRVISKAKADSMLKKALGFGKVGERILGRFRDTDEFRDLPDATDSLQ